MPMQNLCSTDNAKAAKDGERPQVLYGLNRKACEVGEQDSPIFMMYAMQRRWQSVRVARKMFKSEERYERQGVLRARAGRAWLSVR